MEAQTLFFGVLSTQFQYEGREVPLHQQAVLETPAIKLHSDTLYPEIASDSTGPTRLTHAHTTPSLPFEMPLTIPGFICASG